MSRFARNRRVFFVEEPIYDAAEPVLEVAVCPSTNVHVVTPHLSSDESRDQVLEKLLSGFVRARRIQNPIVWFYTPMALEFFPESVTPSAVIYDCMDELSMFRGAPKKLQVLEQHLFSKADLVFTGGVSLFESKRHLHSQVHPFPSGVDVFHFRKANGFQGEFLEHKGMPRPRLGYAGVVDERLDLTLIDEVARRRPDWHVVMIGPIAKVSPDSLPRRDNIHWLGMKDYADLPKYFAGWDVGIMPFALNDSTRFISPTKTPEYLSAGLPVVSTAIRDVVRPYGELGLVRIAHSTDEFIAAAEHSMTADKSSKRSERSLEFLKTLSWDSVWERMNRHIEGVTAVRTTPAVAAAMVTQVGDAGSCLTI